MHRGPSVPRQAFLPVGVDQFRRYSYAIELDPAGAGLWYCRVHARTVAPTPQTEQGVQDATRAIELDPTHHTGYGHRAMAYAPLLVPDWQIPLADMNRHIELFTGHNPEAYRLRPLIHDNLGNHAEAEQSRRLPRLIAGARH